MIANGTEIQILYPSEVGRKGTIVNYQGKDFGKQYLVEFGDLTREWYHEDFVAVDLPKPQKYGTMEVYEDIDVYETENWTTIKVDGDIKYDGHNIDGAELLDVLDIKHNYLYIPDAEMFRLVAGGTSA